LALDTGECAERFVRYIFLAAASRQRVTMKNTTEKIQSDRVGQVVVLKMKHATRRDSIRGRVWEWRGNTVRLGPVDRPTAQTTREMTFCYSTTDVVLIE
jgi:hypothetical protein